MKNLKSLMVVLKNSPVKTTLVVTATAAVITGAVYGIKKIRASKEKGIEDETSSN